MLRDAPCRSATVTEVVGRGIFALVVGHQRDEKDKSGFTLILTSKGSVGWVLDAKWTVLWKLCKLSAS